MQCDQENKKKECCDFSETFHQKKEEMYRDAQQDSMGTVLAFVLLFGICMLFLAPHYGQMIVGVVAGLAFAEELVDWMKGCRCCKKSMIRSAIYIGIAIAFFLSAPYIFIAAAVTIGLRQLYFSMKQ